MDLLLATFAVSLIAALAAVATWLFGDRIIYRAIARIPHKPPVLSIQVTTIYSGASGRGPWITIYVRNMTNSAIEARGLRLHARSDGGAVWNIPFPSDEVEGRLPAHAMAQAAALIRPIDRLCGDAEWFTLTARGNVAGKDHVFSVYINRALTVRQTTRRHVPDGPAPEWTEAPA